MPLTFENPPLVELIAELRWSALPPTGDKPAGLNALPLPFRNTQVDDQFYMQFGMEVSSFGYKMAERLFPPGFPVPLGSVVWRYKNEDNASQLLQVGPGSFAANAVRPYKSWSEFRPSVRQGVIALLKTRPEHDAQFSTVSLRYIDLFTPEFTGKLSETAFAREILGFQVSLPEPVRDRIKDVDAAKLALSLNSEIADDLNLQLSLSDGTISGEHGLIVDTVVTSNGPVRSSVDAVMEIFEQAHVVTHDLFVRMTKPISKILGPQGAE